VAKIRFEEGSYASRIIYYVALAVVFPWQSLHLIPGSHQIILRVISQLKENGYIVVSDKGAQKSIKIAKKAIDILDTVKPGLKDYYMFNSENHTSRGAAAGDKATKLQMLSRKHKVGETYCMCSMAGTRILFNEKPELQIVYSNKCLDDYLDAPLFYNSREIKSVDPEQRHKTEFSRIIGLIISRGGCYNVYNINKGLIKWNQYGENKAKVLTNDIITSNFSESDVDTSHIKSGEAIMFAKDFSAAETFLASKGSRPDGNGFELISFDNTYQDIYLIPLDMYGALQLKVITTPGWRKILLACVFGIDRSPDSSVDCDAYIEDTFCLTLFDGNIARLRRFNQSIYEKGPQHFKILCFPFQTETIKSILDFEIEIQEVEVETFISAFFS
jgi:hypothetical protein